MERTNTSNHPGEPRGPFHEYRGGDMSRRAFLDRAGRFSAVGLSAASMLELELLTPAEASAQQARQGQVGRSISEPNRFDYLPINDRPVIKWPNNARVAFWVAPNMEFFEYLPQSRPTQPDVPSYARNDYGNRVGFWRMLEVFKRNGTRAC